MRQGFLFYWLAKYPPLGGGGREADGGGCNSTPTPPLTHCNLATQPLQLYPSKQPLGENKRKKVHRFCTKTHQKHQKTLKNGLKWRILMRF